jgi:hypothetical protein
MKAHLSRDEKLITANLSVLVSFLQLHIHSIVSRGVFLMLRMRIGHGVVIAYQIVKVGLG